MPTAPTSVSGLRLQRAAGFHVRAARYAARDQVLGGCLQKRMLFVRIDLNGVTTLSPQFYIQITLVLARSNSKT